MSAMTIDRCVCFNVTFAEMTSHLAERDDVTRAEANAALDALRARFGCGRGCALCVPYIRAMLTTGRTSFAAHDPALRASQYDGVAMPETQRQEISITTPAGGQAMRGTLHVPGGSNGARRPAVVLHRGLSSADEAAGDFVEAVAVACAEAGLIALRFEPSVADLLLADFNAYTIADEADDVATAVNAVASRADIDATQISLLGFGLGAIAAAIAGRRLDSIGRFSLIAPATGAYVTSRMLKSNGAPAMLQPQQVPQAWAAALAQSDAPGDAAAAERSSLIVHGAADRFIAPTASLAYLAALEAAKRPVERLLIARADHVFSSPVARQAAVERLVRFLVEPTSAKSAKATGAMA